MHAAKINEYRTAGINKKTEKYPVFKHFREEEPDLFTPGDKGECKHKGKDPDYNQIPLHGVVVEQRVDFFHNLILSFLNGFGLVSRGQNKNSGAHATGGVRGV